MVLLINKEYLHAQALINRNSQIILSKTGKT